MAETTRILLVNDEEVIRYAIAGLLKRAGYEIIEASSGIECLELIRSEKPHLVLLDVVMPGMDGTDVCRKIKADPDLSGVLVILFSCSRINSKDQVNGLTGGADGYIIYPCAGEELLARIGAFARIQRSEQLLRESEEKYRILFELGSDAVVLADGQTGEILEANAAALTLYGYGRDELFQIRLFDLSAEPEISLSSIRQGQTYIPVCFHRKKDGTLFPVEITRSYFTMHRRRVVEEIIRDISERRRMEVALRKGEERYRELFENASMGIFHSLPEGKFLRVNPALAAMMGFESPEEMISSIKDIAGELFADPRKRADILLESLRTTGWSHFESQYRRKDGTVMTASLTMRAVIKADGSIDYFEGFLEDITARKDAEEEKEFRVKALHITSSAGSASELMRQVCTFLKDRFALDAVGIRFRNGYDFPYAAMEGFSQDFLEAESSLCAKKNVDEPIRDEEGRPVLECLCGIVISGHAGASKAYFTERGSFWTNDAEKTLAEAMVNGTLENRLIRGRCLAAGYKSMALIRIQSRETTFGLLQVNGRRRGVFTPRTVTMVERVADGMAIALARHFAEDALREAHGELERRVMDRTAELFKTNEQLQREIEERRRADRQLLESKALLQMVFDGISDMLLMLDKHMHIRMLNRAAKEFFRLANYTEAIGKQCYEGLRGRSRPCRGCQRPFFSLKGYSGSFERKSFADPERLERVVVYPVSNESTGEESIVIRISDITKAKLMERQLIQNEKLASIGLLTSSVAHEINNPNNFISFNIPILRDYLEALMPIIKAHAEAQPGFELFGMSYDELREDIFQLIGNMEHGSARINATVSGLKEFAGKHEKAERALVDISQVIERSVALCRPEISKRAGSFHMTIADGIPPILTDPRALEQVLVNLLINAAHALDKESSCIWLSLQRGERHLCHSIIEVRDNGCGIEETIRQKIFDPFFTTKPSVSGTGLGLYVSHSLVEGLGGKIEVESEPGKGSTFRIVLYGLG